MLLHGSPISGFLLEPTHSVYLRPIRDPPFFLATINPFLSLFFWPFFRCIQVINPWNRAVTVWNYSVTMEHRLLPIFTLKSQEEEKQRSIFSFLSGSELWFMHLRVSIIPGRSALSLCTTLDSGVTRCNDEFLTGQIVPCPLVWWGRRPRVMTAGFDWDFLALIHLAARHFPFVLKSWQPKGSCQAAQRSIVLCLQGFDVRLKS